MSSDDYMIRRVVTRHLQGGRKDKPSQKERALLSAWRWGHITREQLEEKLGKGRVDVLTRKT